MFILQSVFWLFCFLIFYPYIIYPVILLLITRFKTRLSNIKENNNPYYPHLTLLISAYNEEKIINDKILNSLTLDYPADKLQILIADDGSTDNTGKIIKQYQNKKIEYFRSKNNQGKTNLQNEAVKLAKGEIIVFSDANAMYNKNALIYLSKYFINNTIGCVCGNLCYKNSYSGESSESIYWKYEKILKKLESKSGNLIGVNGSIYAIRKKNYIPLDKSAISDFVEPLKLLQNGYIVKYCENAISTETSLTDNKKDFNRKTRIITRSLYGIKFIAPLLNPFRYPEACFKLISHKLLRWSTGVILLFVFFVNILLFNLNILYRVTFFTQISFYLLAITGIITNSKLLFFRLPAYFCLINTAAIISIKNLIIKKQYNQWIPDRE